MDDEKLIPDDLLSIMLGATTPIAPGSNRAQRILRQLKARIRDETRPPAISELLTVAQDSGDWSEPVPGNKVKVLRTDADTQSFLVRLQPGTRFPAHSHPGDEETLVLEGEVRFGDIQLRTGDYHLAREGSFHEEVYSESGCLLFIRAATEQG